ncbi:MAG: serine protease, partial [Planctomycetes bacterium]|nr:serine protease [Planctomycetota bacterium]
NADKERQKALYMVAGRITDIKGNICEQHHWYFGTPEDRYAAEFFMKVEWTVYSSTLRKVVAQFETEGMARHDKPTRQGIFTTFIDAFADATDALANNQDFYHLAKGDAPDQDVIPIAERGQKNFEPLALTQVPVSTQPMGRHMADTQAAVVTVRLGGSHGSGFLIGGNGLILTNYHVVTDTSEVTIVFDSGLEIVGKVLRRDSIRDVALVQVPVRGVAPLPLRLDGTLRATDTVFAIGTPIELDLKTTVTKGVVSAFRQEERTGNRYIQSDVDISGGNSGGPLLDEFGNVVGISVAGVGPVSVGLNLFIPIEDALDALNLHVSGRSGS